jgi:hypothetical protein
LAKGKGLNRETKSGKRARNRKPQAGATGSNGAARRKPPSRKNRVWPGSVPEPPGKPVSESGRLTVFRSVRFTPLTPFPGFFEMNLKGNIMTDEELLEQQLLEQADQTFAAALEAIASGNREAAEAACAAADVAHWAHEDTQSFVCSDPLFELNDAFRAAFGVSVFPELDNF